MCAATQTFQPYVIVKACHSKTVAINVQLKQPPLLCLKTLHQMLEPAAGFYSHSDTGVWVRSNSDTVRWTTEPFYQNKLYIREIYLQYELMSLKRRATDMVGKSESIEKKNCCPCVIIRFFLCLNASRGRRNYVCSLSIHPILVNVIFQKHHQPKRMMWLKIGGQKSLWPHKTSLWP